MRLDDLKDRARRLREETLALYLAARHPRTPWYAKLFVAVVAAYALSPIDLIPDFIPVVGYLDDIVLVPLGVALALRMVPAAVMAECRDRARETPSRPVSRATATVIVLIWVAAAALLAGWAYRFVSPSLLK